MSEPELPDVDVPLEEPAGPEPVPEPDPTPEPPDEPDEPQEPADEPAPEPSSEAVMEEIGKKLDALNKTVATRIATILGDNALDFEVCDLCSYWNTPGWRHKGHLPEDLKAQMAYLIGQRADADFCSDAHSTACSSCGGEGAVLTGSKVVGQDKLPCVECEGMGWVPTDDARRRGRLQLANGPTATALGVTPQDAAMSPTPQEEDPEVAALRAKGYVVVPPIAASA